MEPDAATARPIVVLNPAANRGNMGHFRRVAQRHAQQANAEYVETRQRGDARKFAFNAASEGRPVIIVGGDGSVNETVNGLLAVGKQVPFGIVPAGSGNDFACQTLKLPRDPEVAIERALHGDLIQVDAGIANDRYFANSFSVGLDADVAVTAEKLKPYPFMTGIALYYTSSLRQLFFGYKRCPWLTLALDDASLTGDTPQRHVLVAVTNGPTYGGGFRINPQANHTDGQFDVCAITYTPRFRALNLLPIVKKGQHQNEPEVSFHHARHVLIDVPQGAYAQMDGETFHATTFDVRILPGALLMRV